MVQGFELVAQDPADQVGLADFPVELDVLGDGKTRDQHKLLVYHPNALFHGNLRGGDIGRLPCHQNLSPEAAGRVDHRHAKEDVHQGGLASTILAQQGVNLPRADLERHVP